MQRKFYIFHSELAFFSNSFTNSDCDWLIWFGFQDFADILSQPSLESPADTEPEHEADTAAASLSGPAINTLVQVHQCVCLGYAQSLWYQSTPPTNHSKEHIKALISSHQIASPVMTHFYHLIG